MPLIFGTIKATVYSLLFAIPIALGAAIYTSEFVHHRVRAVVKPTMELMASLPSVVLGFIAALILAPIVETLDRGDLSRPFGHSLPRACSSALIFGSLLQASPIALRYGGLPKFVTGSFIALLVFFG